MERRELYAKTALLLFCPLRSLEDIQVDGKYWKKFDGFRKFHFNLDANVSPGTEVHQKFYEKGFDILHNINTRLTVEKCQGRAMDPVTKVTTHDVTEDERNKKSGTKQKDDDDDIRPITFFCQDENEDEYEHFLTEWNLTPKHQHGAILKQLLSKNAM